MSGNSLSCGGHVEQVLASSTAHFVVTLFLEGDDYLGGY